MSTLVDKSQLQFLCTSSSTYVSSRLYFISRFAPTLSPLTRCSQAEPCEPPPGPRHPQDRDDAFEGGRRRGVLERLLGQELAARREEVQDFQRHRQRGGTSAYDDLPLVMLQMQ